MNWGKGEWSLKMFGGIIQDEKMGLVGKNINLQANLYTLMCLNHFIRITFFVEGHREP